MIPKSALAALAVVLLGGCATTKPIDDAELRRFRASAKVTDLEIQTSGLVVVLGGTSSVEPDGATLVRSTPEGCDIEVQIEKPSVGTCVVHFVGLGGVSGTEGAASNDAADATNPRDSAKPTADDDEVVAEENLSHVHARSVRIEKLPDGTRRLRLEEARIVGWTSPMPVVTVLCSGKR